MTLCWVSDHVSIRRCFTSSKSSVVSEKNAFLHDSSDPEIAEPTSCAGGRHNMPAPCKLTFDLLTLKVVSESRVTWATCVPILIFLGLSVLILGPMYATDRPDRCQTASSLNAPYHKGGGIITLCRILWVILCQRQILSTFIMTCCSGVIFSRLLRRFAT